MAAIVRYVNTNSTAGGDGTTDATTGVNRAYSSQNEMEAAEQTNLVTAGDTFTGICAGGIDSADVIYSGWTTDATHDILITTTTDRHSGVFDNTKYYMDVGQSTATILNIQEDFFSAIGLQFNRQTIAASGVDRTCIRINLVGAGLIKTEQCIFKSVAFDTAGVVSAIAIDDSSPVYTFKNNISYGFNGSTHAAITGLGASAVVEIYNNTFIDHSVAIQSRANYLCKNNIFQDCVTDINGTLNASNDYNLTDNVSIAGVNSVTSSTLTFKNKATNNYALVAGDTDAIGAGIGPSSDANVPIEDVIGTARTGATTDIGAFMFVGGGGTTVTINQSDQLQTIDQVTLTQHSVISIGGLSQAQTIGQVTLQQSGTLSINNLQQIQAIDQVNLTQAHIVSVNGLSQLQTIDQVSLNQGNVLSVNDTDQLQTLGQVTLSAAGTVAINNASQVQALEQLVLSIAGTVAINSLSQSQLLEQLNLTQAHVVSVDNLSQAQLLQSINFNGVVVGYLQGALTIVSAYNGSIKLTNPLTGEIRIL